jgi:cell wall-associated NlpC family hydrolase
MDDPVWGHSSFSKNRERLLNTETARLPLWRYLWRFWPWPTRRCRPTSMMELNPSGGQSRMRFIVAVREMFLPILLSSLNSVASSKSRDYFWRVCCLVFCFFCAQTVFAQSKPADSQPPSCKLTQPGGKKKAKPNTRATTPTKAARGSAPDDVARSKRSASHPWKADTLPSPSKNVLTPARPGTTVANGKSKPLPASQVSTRTKAKAEAIASELAVELPSNLEQEIKKFFGLRYQLGGEGQNGIDCSALVKHVYSDAFGVSLPRNSTEQSRLGSLENVPRDDLKAGDLVFFGPNRKTVNHVGMYLAGGHFLNATRSEGVTISRLDNSYWKSRFMFSKRMRGIDMGEDDDDSKDFESDFTRDSYRLTLDRENDSEVSFLDFGVKLNDWLELLMSAFFHNSLAGHGPAGDISPLSSSMAGPESTADSGGGRMSAVISPLDWIKLIPSISQVEMRDGRSCDYQKFGLETWMILPSTRLAVFMAAYATNQDNLFERPLSASPEWQTMDMAFGLHYKLSDSLRFSLWGTHGYTPDARGNKDTGAERRLPIDDVSFELNVQF